MQTGKKLLLLPVSWSLPLPLLFCFRCRLGVCCCIASFVAIPSDVGFAASAAAAAASFVAALSGVGVANCVLLQVIMSFVLQN